MKRKKSSLPAFLSLGLLILFILGIYLFLNRSQHKSQQDTSQRQTQQASTKKSTANLPNISAKNWKLVLVNRDHVRAEMSPALADVDGISVDARIAQKVREFLQAAQNIDASEHLISGYRSVAYQEELYNSYISQEKINDPSLTQAEAEKKVQTYSQPPGSSEHQTGLAIDMSTVDSLNQSNPEVVAKVAALAPKYGFVLRFPKGKKAATGIGYEDWHYRYVGVKSAEYMTKHHLTLEEYLKKLKEK